MNVFNHIEAKIHDYKKREYNHWHSFELSKVKGQLDVAVMKLNEFWDVRNKIKGLV